jgi:hypothetical protein
VRNRAYLDEVMIRLELDNDGYESLLSDCEEEIPSLDGYKFDLELEYKEAVSVQDVLGIDIPGVVKEDQVRYGV